MKDIQGRLEEGAVDIKGKKYILVKDRIMAFNELYPNGSITTRIESEMESKMVVVKAQVIPDVSQPRENQRSFTGFSQAIWGDGYINKTSALENAETSAVGRALAFMGIGVLDSIASVDEINKAKTIAASQEIVGEAEKQVNRAREAAINKVKGK